MNQEEAVDLLDAWNQACRAVRSGPRDSLAEAQKKGIELYDQIIAALCEDKWIPIPDILPEPYKDFLVWMPLEDPPIEIGYFDHEFGKDWFRGEERFPLSAVTRYQPLPEGPKEGTPPPSTHNQECAADVAVQ